MARPLRNPLVRRRLFFEDEEPSANATTDNTINIIREMITTDQKRLMEKWNFDPENDRQLHEDGHIEWTRSDGRYCWIGKVTTDVPEEAKDSDDMRKIKDFNEVTPRAVKDDEDRVMQLRKRRKDDGKSCTDRVKRRISFV